MTNYAKCNICSFEFCSSLDHATKQMEIICVACLSRYVIVHDSPYGAASGDQLNIWKTSKKRKQTLTTQTISVINHPSEAGLITYLINEVSCPTCNKFKIVMNFEDGDLCPKCENGVLRKELVE